MKTCQHYSQLADGMCNWLVPSHVTGMMSGARYAQQMRDGTITLTYEDGTTESRASERDMVQQFDSFLAVVSYVQAGRKS